jgi:hypothetical protein
MDTMGLHKLASTARAARSARTPFEKEAGFWGTAANLASKPFRWGAQGTVAGARGVAKGWNSMNTAGKLGVGIPLGVAGTGVAASAYAKASDPHANYASNMGQLQKMRGDYQNKIKAFEAGGAHPDEGSWGETWSGRKSFSNPQQRLAETRRLRGNLEKNQFQDSGGILGVGMGMGGWNPFATQSSQYYAQNARQAGEQLNAGHDAEGGLWNLYGGLGGPGIGNDERARRTQLMNQGKFTQSGEPWQQGSQVALPAYGDQRGTPGPDEHPMGGVYYPGYKLGRPGTGPTDYMSTNSPYNNWSAYNFHQHPYDDFNYHYMGY